MNISATVVNDSIKLPAGTHLADGTQVLVLAQAPSETMAQRYGKFVGILKDGPADLAANHDHYLYGTPKREA
jgi:hypothetical protein